MSSPSSSSKGPSKKLGSLLALAGIAGLAVLGSTLAPADAAITFGAAADTPGSIVNGLLTGMVPKPVSLFDKYLVPGLMNFTGISVDVNTSTRVIVGVNATLLNPFGPVTLPLGVVGVKVFLDGQSLANVTTSDLTLSAGAGPLNVTATIDVADGNTNPGIQTSISNLVTSLFGGVTPSGAPPKLTISGISLSGTEMGLDPFDVPTAGLLPAGPIVKSNATSPTGKPPVFGINGLFNPAINFTMPTLNKVIVKAVTGAELIAGVGFTWQNPLNVAIDVPFLAIDIGLNGTNVVNVGIENLFLAPGNMHAETLVHLKFNNEPEAANQLGAFVNDFLAGTVNQVVNIGNFTFGAPSAATPTTILLNSLLGGLDFNLPLLNVSTVAIQEMIMGAVQPYLPIDISKLGSGPSMLSYLQSLAISTAPGHTLLISPKIQVPLPFELDLNIPYFGLDIKLDDSLLGTLFLADLVGTGSGQVAISVGVGIVFQEPSGPIPGTVAKIVNGITTGSSLDIKAGIANMQIGVSPQDAVSTLSTLDFGVPISSLVTGKLSTGDLLGSIMSQTNVTISPNAVAIKVGSLAELTIHEANIAVLPNNLITAAINLDVFLGLPIVANIGYLGLQVSLDGSTLAGVDLTTGLNYGGGKVQMNAGVALSVGTGEAISNKVAALVNAVIAHQPVTSSIGVTGIVIGHSNVDVISALSELSVSLPLGGLLGGNAPGLPAGFLDKLIAQLGLGVSELSLATIPNAGLAVGAKAIFSNPIPISVSVPFIGVRGGLDKVDIVNVGVNDLAIVPGANVLQASINLNFNNAIEAQQKVATFLGELLGGQLGNTPEALTIHDLRIGASPSDYFDLLSKIDISIPSKDVINKANIDLITAKLGLGGTGAIDNLLNNLKIGALSLDLNKAPVIDLGTSVSVSNFSLNAAVNIGYFGIDLALDNHALARVDVPSITIATANNQLTLAVKASITVQDTPEVQTDIANLFDFFMNNGTTSPVNSLVISRPLVGVSTSDNIQTFALIKYPIALPPLLLKAKAYVNQILAGAGGLMNNIAVSGLVVDLNSPSIISVQGGLQVKNFTLPADISISYVGVSLGLDATPMADLTVPSLALTSANGALNVNFNALVDVKQSPELNGQIAKLVGAIMYPGQVAPPTNAVIYDPVFGGDKNHLFHILKQIKFNVALAPYLKKIGDLINGALAGGSGNLLAGLDIGSLVVDLNSPQTIGIDAAISLKNVTIPAEIKLNYVGVNLAIDTIALAQVAVPSFTLKPVAGALSITAHVDVALLPSAALTTAISNLVTGIISNQTTPATNLVISGAVFGGSPTAVFTILQGIAIPINVAPYINKIPALIGGSGPLSDRVAFGALVVDLNSPQTIGVDTSISIKNITLPAQIKLNYVGADIAIGQVPFVKLGVPKFSMNPNNGNLDIALHADLAIQESAGLTATINALVGAVLGGQPIPSTQVVISGAAFGGSPTNVFTLLQGVKIPIEVSPYLNKLIGSIGSANGTNLVVDLNSPQTIGIDAGVSIKNVTLPAEIKLNYVGADVAIGQVPVAKFGVPTFSMTPNNGNLDIVLHANIDIMESNGLTATINGLVHAVMAGQPIPSTQLIISSPAFGASPSNVFTFLQGVKVPIEISTYLNKFLGSVGASNPATLLGSIGFSDLVIDLNSPQVVGIDAGILIKNVTLPAQIKLNYVGANAAINGIPMAQVAVPAFTMAPQGADLALKVHVDVSLLSTPQLTKAISDLVGGLIGGQPLPKTDLIISGAVFGGSSTNTFTFLQGVAIPIDVSALVSKLGGAIGGAGSLLNGIGLSGLAINLNNAPVVGIDANIAVSNLTLPAKLNVGYFGLGIAYSGVPLVDVSVPKIVLGNSGNTLTIGTHIDATLMETDASQSVVAALVNAVVAGQAPQGNLIISNIAFGASKGNVFNILKDVQIPVPIAKLLSMVPSTPGTNGTSILDKLTLNSADINMKNPPSIGADIDAALVGYSFDAQLLLNYVKIQAFLDSTPLATVNVPGIKLASGNNQVSLVVHSLVDLASGGEIQSKVAAIAQQVMGGGGSQNVNLVVSNIAFGGSAGSVFHILDKVKVSVPLAPYIQKLTGIVGGIIGGTPAAPGAPAFTVKNLEISAPGANDLSVAVSAAIGGIGSKISVQMPYVGLEVTAGGNGFVYPTINNFQLQNGNIDLTLALPFQPAAKNIIASLSTPVSQLMFSTVGTVPGAVVVNSIKFGASPSQAFDIAAKIGLEIQLNSVFQKAQAYINAHNPLHVNDMNTVLTSTGIQATITVPGIPLTVPLKMNFPISLSGYHKGNRILAIQATSMSLGQSPWALGAGITVVQPAFSTAMNSILPNALQWKNALQDVTLGGVTLGSFTGLQGLMITPPEVVLWSPITIPLNQLKVHLSPLGMDFTAAFVNRGPLQVDMGTINVMIEQGTTDVIQISNLGGPIHLNNGNQNGGNNALAMNAALKFNFLEFFKILAALFNPSNFKFVFSMRTSSGQEMPWLQDALNGVPAAIFNNLLPILAKALSNVKFTL
ncbi:hypothetical protein BGZ92_003650 [Podila epicladia]|nr:hypothetical protein BGZ92_003650 [Podila epicladia]